MTCSRSRLARPHPSPLYRPLVGDDAFRLVQVACTFCGKTHEEAQAIIAGRGGYICADCVYACVEILQEEDRNT